MDDNETRGAVSAAIAAADAADMEYAAFQERRRVMVSKPTTPEPPAPSKPTDAQRSHVMFSEQFHAHFAAAFDLWFSSRMAATLDEDGDISDVLVGLTEQIATVFRNDIDVVMSEIANLNSRLDGINNSISEMSGTFEALAQRVEQLESDEISNSNVTAIVRTTR